jgi:amino acid adenylation domain-containing protein
MPLDPEYPTERLDYMIEDSGIGLLLSQSHLKDSLPTKAGLRVLELDSFDLSDQPEHDPQVEMHGDNLAYVIYTSGSTGKPKGVMVRYEALSHFLLSMQQQPGLTENDILVAVTSLSFDIAALELYLPLISGARTVIASREEARDGEAFARLIEQSQATVLQCTPANWRLLLAVGWSGIQDRPFRGLCGGEALQPDLADNLRNIGVELWNMYGPTETTIWSVISPVSDHVSLGRAIGGTQLRVLDTGLNPVPIRVAGELYLGGIGLARGYLNRASFSAEHFVADPFDEEGGRLYRTGDLVRWNAEGQLEYLGRIDHQVKIRGFRIELGEVEAQLLAQPAVREAVVVTKQSAAGAQLVGYVSTKAEGAIDTAMIRERLSQTLPDYMVPSAIVVLESLPLNANGKVDRKGLPEPEFTGGRAYEAPEGQVEEALARIWSEVLGVERVGRYDNFFELGGHSLAAIQITALLFQRHGYHMPVRHFFDRPILRALASMILPDSFAGACAKAQRLSAMDRLLNEFEV